MLAFAFLPFLGLDREGAYVEDSRGTPKAAGCSHLTATQESIDHLSYSSPCVAGPLCYSSLACTFSECCIFL